MPVTWQNARDLTFYEMDGTFLRRKFLWDLTAFRTS